jgi:hypothetical protein
VGTGFRGVLERDARGDLRPALASPKRSTVPFPGSVDGVAFDAPSPGVFEGQAYGNPQVREDAGKLSWLSASAVYRWATGYRAVRRAAL